MATKLMRVLCRYIVEVVYTSLVPRPLPVSGKTHAVKLMFTNSDNTIKRGISCYEGVLAFPKNIRVATYHNILYQGLE